MKVFCPHCSSDVGFHCVYSAQYEARGYSTDMTDYEGSPFPAKMFVAQCGSCGMLVLHDDIGACLDEAHFLEALRVFPQAIHEHGAIPKKVRDAYEHALRVMWLDPNAFALLIRRAIETICSEEAITGPTLEVRLNRLQRKRNLPGDIAEVAKKLRLLGNRAAHDVEKGLHPLHTHSACAMKT